jgi:signal transduction histidine kinase
MQRLERERLIAMLGHELKTPLATLRMMLGDKTLPQHAAQQMSEPIQEINELIERTVQTGQLENDAIGVRPLHCKLATAIEQPLAQLPDFNRIAWTAHPPAQEIEVVIDPFLLGVVVRNLVDNALKYSPDGSPVQVDLHTDAKLSLWVLEVHNQVGRAGLPDAEHVFDKFWRSPKASYRSGSGQGLFIAWRLAQLMGGTLRYLPEGDSVCFRLELPFEPPTQGAAV